MAGCVECHFDWRIPADSLPDQIATVGSRFRAATADVVARHAMLDPGVAIASRPAPDVWSALEYAAHMRDIVEFYQDRIERVLVEDRPVMSVAMSFAEMAEVRRYRDEVLASVLESLERRADVVRARLERLDDQAWARIGIGSSGGRRTVLDLARRLAHEGHHHQLDIDRLVLVDR